MVIKDIKNHLINIPGWLTNRKIVVFESDDWGSIRTSSNEALKDLKRVGVNVENCNFMMNDSLASYEDMEILFDTLSKYQDRTGNYPVFTANCIVANPDFEKIKESEFQKYFYEPFHSTLKRYSKHENSLSLWKQGINQKILYPQLHGREHVQISRWLYDLQHNVNDTRLAFDHEMFGVSGHVSLQKRESYLAALDIGRKDIQLDRKTIIAEAQEIFKDTFGFRSESFIAPNYIWDDSIEKSLWEQNVRFIQGTHAQRVSKVDGEERKIKHHYLGQKNKFGQLYLTRNVLFEPSEDLNKDWVGKALNEIKIAFRMKKPAIISSHRVNYIGYLNSKNRDRGIRLLNELLAKMLKKWPEIEFLTSDQLGRLILENK